MPKIIKWSASSRWSFGPNSAWDGKEIIVETHPTLLDRIRKCQRQMENPPKSVFDFGSRLIISVVPINEFEKLFKPSTFCQNNDKS